mmetsp:Transcript_27290/g.62954  ORF Transcript_27290/g.62954 Transcript_27290/m.62954 type:complete len:128 (-) Transcript_27290:1178-1561(-)
MARDYVCDSNIERAGAGPASQALCHRHCTERALPPHQVTDTAVTDTASQSGNGCPQVGRSPGSARSTPVQAHPPNGVSAVTNHPQAAHSPEPPNLSRAGAGRPRTDDCVSHIQVHSSALTARCACTR